MAGARWWHSTTESKLDMVTLEESRVEAAMGIVWLTETYDVGHLVIVFLEMK